MDEVVVPETLHARGQLSQKVARDRFRQTQTAATRPLQLVCSWHRLLVAPHVLLQVAACTVLEHEVHVFVRLVNRIEFHHIRVINLPHNCDFHLEIRQQFAAQLVERQRFDRHGPFARLVVPLVHDGKRAAAELTRDHIVADRGARHERSSDCARERGTSAARAGRGRQRVRSE